MRRSLGRLTAMETRILIYAPTGQDAQLAAKVLAMASIDSHVCRSLAELATQLELGAGAVLTVEEALAPGGYKLLLECVARLPDWSDLPIILLTHRGADSSAVRQAVAGLGNLSLMERPVRLLTRLVDDLLDVARITSGKIKLQRQLVALSAVMDHVSELCLQAANAKRIHIAWQLPAEEIMLDADYARVVQIFERHRAGGGSDRAHLPHVRAKQNRLRSVLQRPGDRTEPGPPVRRDARRLGGSA